MEFEINRLDHYGVVAGVIKDLKMIEHIDSLLGVHDQSEISHGEAIAGMILNGLGFTDRPVSLTPQFFESKPLELLFREGVRADHFNRFKLGRSLDASYDYGCEVLFEKLAASVCQQEQVDCRFGCEDTTSFSVTGEYLPDEDTQAISITHGYSKDHRPDLKQVVLEMMTSQDGGIPLLMKCWNGNSDDNTIFQHRAKKLIEVWKEVEPPRYLIMDSKGYSEKNAINLKSLKFITRIPETNAPAKIAIQNALKQNIWENWDEQRKYTCLEIEHYNIEQRWVIVFSEAAFNRSEKTVEKASIKEKIKIEKALYHLQAERFKTETEARSTLEKLRKKWKYYQLTTVEVEEHKKYLSKGRPGKNSPFEITYQIKFEVEKDLEQIRQIVREKACFIVGTNTPQSELGNLEVLQTYQKQDHVEKGFGFLKSSLCFASAFFLEKPSRIEGLIMVMTLALLVYTTAQRRLRKALKKLNKTIPNQIKQPSKRPTMRWIFQILEGINQIVIREGHQVRVVLEGLNELRRKILSFLGGSVAEIYQIRSRT
ncbi:MAG: IS1634 family transposase [Desulfobacterales bacterium]|nr:IS1634 family transposase [Desulfobacterales bacterium]